MNQQAVAVKQNKRKTRSNARPGAGEVLEMPPRYEIVMKTRDDIPVLKHGPFAMMVLKSFQFHIRSRIIKVYGWTLLPSEAHVLMRTDEPGRVVQRVKNYTSKQIIEYLEHYHPEKVPLFMKGRASVWDRGFSEKQVEAYGDYRRSLQHLHGLPVERNLVQSPLEYKWSSARDRLENRGLIWLSG